MRAPLDFDFQAGGVVRLTNDLQAQLDSLSDSHQQPIYQDIARYLQQTINRRIDNQVDPKDRPWLPRKHRYWNGKKRPLKMLLGMKRTQINIKDGQVSVGYEGMRGVIAGWHNNGTIGSDGKRRAPRQWLDLSKNDIQTINKIIIRHLSSA